MYNLPRELMAKITSFLDYRSLCKLHHCNKTWCEILSSEQTWNMLLHDHYQISEPFPDMTSRKSYERMFFPNECLFCSDRAVKILCSKCSAKAWAVCEKYYGNDGAADIARTSKDFRPWESITFKYATAEHEKNNDITDAEFIIGHRNSIAKMCWPKPKPLIAPIFLDLASNEFWEMIR